MSTLNPRAATPHGFIAYSRCVRCGTERPATGLVFLGAADGVCIPPGVCNDKDRAWCDRQAGVGTGLDVNGDALQMPAQSPKQARQCESDDEGGSGHG